MQSLCAMCFWMTLLWGQEPSSRAPLREGGRAAVLLISGSDAYHNWRRTTPQMRTLIEKSGKFDVRLVEDVHILESREALRSYKVIVFNQQTASSTPLLRQNLTDYLEKGGGLVALHWAIDNFHDWREFKDVLGRVWQEGVSAEEHGTFDVKIIDHEHPITRGMPDFRTAEGEAIHFHLRGNAPIHVLATTNLEGSRAEVPVMFTHIVGRGRVFFTPFGHSEITRENQDFQRMILRAVEWAATEAKK